MYGTVHLKVNAQNGGYMNIMAEFGYKYDLNAHVEKSLIERIEDTFKQSLASKLKGKVPEQLETEVERINNVYNPVLVFRRQDVYTTGTKTTVKIPVGRAIPEQNIYFADINGNGYEQYSSLEAIGIEAAEVFHHQYGVDVRGA